MREAMVIGEAGQRIARNLKRLREQQKLSLVEVSQRLADIGRPIPVPGVRRIEKCERRVDIDDLIALAAVLHVPAERLALDDDLAVEVRVVVNATEPQIA